MADAGDFPLSSRFRLFQGVEVSDFESPFYGLVGRIQDIQSDGDNGAWQYLVKIISIGGVHYEWFLGKQLRPF